MKKQASIITLGLAALALVVTSVVNAEVYTIGANVPSSTGASFTVSKVTDGVFTPHASNNLSFGELSLDSDNGIFLAPYYFNIDVGGVGGSGIPSIDIQYSDTGSPTGATTDLGDHGTFSYFSITEVEGSEVQTDLDFLSLHEADGLTITSTDLGSGFLRIALGVSTGNPPVEGDAVPFNLGSAPGTYTGTLTLTAVAE